MQRQLAAFVEQPSKTTYLAARDAVLSQSSLPLVATELAELDRLLDEEQHQEILNRLDLLPPSKVLSPRVHFLAAEAALGLGQDSDVELERSLFVLTLQGLLATGDGTPANPYIVCHPTDEHDIVAALGKEAAGQSLVENEGRLCDRIVCSDGREVWFDVTELVTTVRHHKKVSRRRQIARRSRPAKRLRSLGAGG
jgi:hypothetical protein